MDSSQKLSERFKAFIPKSIQCFKDGYSFKSFFKDLIAGSNVAIISFPLALAVAIGVGIDPEHGLFTAVVAGILISLLGGSRVQIGGPTSTLIVVLYGIMLRHGYEGMLMATFLAGLILMIFGFAGLGTYIKYIPYPVVAGLTTGIAVVLFSSQFKDFLGLQMGEVPIDFIAKWQAYFDHIHTFDPTTLVVGFLCLATMAYTRRYKPKIPGVLIALGGAAFISWMFNLNIETIGSKYGTLARTLPSPAFPFFQFHELLDLVPEALTIAILVGIESLLSAVVSEGMTGWRHQSNCELVAQGFANLTSTLFGGLPAAGSISRTAANVKFGASTPISGMVHAGVIFLMMYLFAPLMSRIPLAALAAVLIMMAWNMSELRHFFHLFTAPRRDILILITVFTLTVLINLTAAVQIGMILAAFLFMKQMSDLSGVVSNLRAVDDTQLVDPDAITDQDVPEGIEVFEINGPLFFGVADRLKNILKELERPPKIFILRMQRVPTIDASGMHALEEFYLECHKQKTTLLLAGVKGGPLKDLKRYHLDQLIGDDNIFPHLIPALEFSRELIRIQRFKQAMR
ncbi:MAG: C4-dicarboxylic acid transporter DauA [Chlamydiales bacterium]|nr:C4-dicarboxylic acid transporter DauA [Chlamydiales bacterium]MCH9620376.1 C4-dicarboxylic acid transporter DauA [Chlamydiales bacterium]MCH9622978.1 C4-dicarboxylic acid transporter DauA [Chlamydiales bacterium]